MTRLNTNSRGLLGRVLVLGLLAAGAAGTLRAFPPAPHHEIYGLVRNEQGDPLESATATVLLEVGGTNVASTVIRTTPAINGNYRLNIPLDSGLTAERYRPSAQFPAVPFRLRVKVGNVSYVPIVITGVSSLVTKPGGSTRVDLTVGEDSDGDGLPDAWERELIAALGLDRTLAQIRPDGDDDGDGMTNMQEYLAGTYAWDPQDGFALAIRGVQNGRPVMEFTGIRGRTYSVETSHDLKTWKPITFQVDGGADQDSFTSPDVRPVHVSVAPAATNTPSLRVFRLMVR